MFKHLSFDQFHALMPHNKKILVYKQFPGDIISPILTYGLIAPQPPSALIEIHYPQEDFHYSFLGIDPFFTYHVKNGVITYSKELETSILACDPLQLLWELTQKELCVGTDIFPIYFGGVIGFAAYDAIHMFEKLPNSHPDPDNYPDLLFHAYSTMISFDHKTRVMTIGKATLPNEEAYYQSLQDIENCYQSLTKTIPTLHLRKTEASLIEVEMDDNAFKEQVQKVQESIQKNEIHKTIISRSFTRQYSGSPLALFRASRMLNPSPCHFLLHYPEFSLVGASPGKLISVKGRALEITPLAGTYPRKGIADDKHLDEQLLNDPKEHGEHMMLVEAVKKELAKVSIPGSVHISKLKALEHFSHVTHIVSYVNGTLNPRYHALNAFLAAFPAGTLSGIPKIRAMEIIDHLEKSRRGIYAGAVCALDARGNLDSVLINRTAVLKEGKATVRAGAGIVKDSDPQKEADESRHKAKAMLESLQLAEDYFS